MLGELKDVRPSYPQGRDGQLDDVDAKEEVLAKPALLDGLFQVPVGRRHDANVDRHLLRAAHGPHGPLLKHAQQLRLQRHGHVADLIEEERPPRRLLEQTRARLLRIRECPAHVAEELRLEQRLRDRGAVDRHERPTGSAAARVKSARHELLARAALPCNQDGHLGVGNAAEHVHDMSHGVTVAHEVRWARSRVRRLVPQSLHFLAQPLVAHRAIHRDAECVELDRLVDEIVRPRADRLHGGLHRPECGEHQHWHVGPARDDAYTQVDPGRSPHVQVGHDRIAPACREGVDGLV